ncbi:DUF6159 family protein [Amycolatopsis magusensis]|uniref:Glycerophosphoryl diester phosphodiesterase membrane domain-containing protein n=1 Tax=Amycolatopsis magusensis TaxID=882444 RepID=A0ABS4PTR5_9PSEU|nr:DUF6159 family protein [Amycolatopsis magusensis]MBP2182821.1 hypothetical protein [Amycolatopsis magusensis]
MFKASWRVLRTQPRIAGFPVLSGLTVLLVAAAFLTPALFAAQRPGMLGWVLLAAGCLLAITMVTTFFKAALISQADVALRGERARIGSGLVAAGRRWPGLLAWSVLTLTVSAVLRAIEDRMDFALRFLGALADIGWNLIAYLVLPVLTLEGMRLRDAPKRSAELLRRTWGENIAGYAGLSLLGMVASATGVAAVIGLGSLIGGRATLYVCLLLSLVWVLLVAVVVATLNGIYQTALYRFATGEAFSAALGDLDLRDSFSGTARGMSTL